MSSPLVSLVGTLILALGASVAADAAEPDALAAKAGCTICHAKDKKVLGPSFHDIAAKYKDDAKAPALLADRVRKGSKGVWGTTAMMTPVPASRISDPDLATVIGWVLKQ